MVSEKERKDKGKNSIVSAVDREDIVTNELGDRGDQRGQPDMAAEIALLRRQLNALIEHLGRDWVFLLIL